MNTKQAIAKLFSIASRHQEMLTKMAQGAPQGEALTAALQAKLFEMVPQAKSVLIEGPSVATSDGGKLVVFYKHKAGKNAEALKQAIMQAADQVLGAGRYTIQAIGQF